jgi:hypothetical protein
MEPLIIQPKSEGFVGTWWAVTEEGRDLEVYETQQEAETAARNRLSYAGQPIKLKRKNGATETLRQGDDRAQQSGGQGGYGGGGLFGGGYF